MTTANEVEVPEPFRRMGYSGLFWQEVTIDPGFTKEPPCLLSPGWMLLSRKAFRGIVVRRDEVAVVEAFRAPIGRPTAGG